MGDVDIFGYFMPLSFMYAISCFNLHAESLSTHIVKNEDLNLTLFYNMLEKKKKKNTKLPNNPILEFIMNSWNVLFTVTFNKRSYNYTE